MSTLIVRSILSPLKLAPASYSSVHVLLSPLLSGQQSSDGGASTTEGTTDEIQPQAPFLPSSSLPALVERCASLSSGSTFQPSPQLPSGHLQTIYSTLADTVEQDAVHYTRRVIMLPDGGLISLDICEGTEEKIIDDKDARSSSKPTVVIAHGLTGGSQESYVRHCVKQLCQSHGQEQQSYRCVVVNFRGCANTPVTSSQLYSAAKTSDLRSAILFLQTHYPRSPMVGLGFSLGANVMAKYLGEEGDTTPLLGGIVCAAPFDLKKGSDLMENNTFRRQVYSRAMNGNLTRLATKHAATLDLDEKMREPLDTIFDEKLAQEHVVKRGELVANSRKTLKFVDDNLVVRVGGHHKPYGEFPFDSSDAYYKHGGAINFLHGLRRPMLALNADDDPIVAAGSVSSLRSLMGYHDGQDGTNVSSHDGHTEYIVLATTQGGGHLGWWQGVRKPTRWLAQPVVEFVDALIAESAKLGATQPEHVPLPSTSKRQITVELMPAQLLPPYRSPQQRGADNGSQQKDLSKTAAQRQDAAYKHGARLPWLRTQLLCDAPIPLLHPSMARQGWTGDAPLNTAEFTVDTDGQLNKDTPATQAQGWCAFEATMTVDEKRPEVGFCQLQAWTRVGGAGEHFQGGKEMPGLYESQQDDGMVAGL